MTKEQILALSGRELDEAVAERIMGWRWYTPKVSPRSEYRFLMPADDYQRYTVAEDVQRKGNSSTFIPPYSTSLGACREAEKELLKRSSHAAYWSMLRNVVIGKDYLGSSAQMGQVATATAEQRCRAMLIARLGELSQ